MKPDLIIKVDTLNVGSACMQALANVHEIAHEENLQEVEVGETTPKCIGEDNQ